MMINEEQNIIRLILQILKTRRSQENKILNIKELKNYGISEDKWNLVKDTFERKRLVNFINNDHGTSIGLNENSDSCLKEIEEEEIRHKEHLMKEKELNFQERQILINENQLHIQANQNYFNMVVAITGTVVSLIMLLDFLMRIFDLKANSLPDWIQFLGLIVAGIFIASAFNFIKKHINQMG
ncbi:hypothetical protein HYX00_05165 [Candidatus Woesearchaeota archaeon]|nr:hypothetical protein [Candidatus Woesearchaeota archaeon]